MTSLVSVLVAPHHMVDGRDESRIDRNGEELFKRDHLISCEDAWKEKTEQEKGVIGKEPANGATDNNK